MKHSNSAKFQFGVTVDSMDPITKKVYEGLCEGKSKKELSNKYRMPISTVNIISKRFKTGLDKQISPAIREYDDVNMEQIVEEKHEESGKVLKMNQPEVEIDVKPQRKKRKSPTTEDIEMVIELVKEGYTSDQIAELTDLSKSTVSRIRTNNGIKVYNSNRTNKKLPIIKTTPKPAKEEKKAEPVQKKESKDLVPISANNSIRVGLVADRHSMPVNDFIFKEALSKELMFDYDKIEEICRDYIKDMIDFDKNGKALQSLIVYVTGIQCASSSLIKVANEMKVNLTFRHYDTDTKTYHTQIIWNKFNNTLVPDELCELLMNSRSSYTYKCDVKELLKNGSLAKLTEVHYDDNSNLDYQDMYLALDTTMAFELANKRVDEANKKNEKVSIYIKGFDFKKGRFIPNGFDLKLRTKN